MADIKTKKRALIATISFFSLLLILSLSLFCYQRAYAGKIYRNVSFDGVPLQGKTKAQAKTIIENQVSPQFGKKIITKSQEGKEFEAKFSETGTYVDAGQIVREAYEYGRNSNFLKTLYLSSTTIFSKKNLSYEVKFDGDVYGQYLAKAAESLNIPPTDANLEVKSGQVVTNVGKNGITIDSSNLKTQISQEFKAKVDSAVVEMPTMPITPTLLSEDLAEAQKQAEDYLSHQIQLTLNGQVYNADRNTIGSWISFGSSGSKYVASLNTGAIKNYVNKIAAKNDTPVIDTKINAVDNSVLQEGRQGIYTDQDDAVSKITAALQGSSLSSTIQLIQTPRDPQIVKVFPDEGIVPGRFPGKYIDISLSSQLLTTFEGTNQLGQYQVSTGKSSMPTPTGLKSVIAKDPRAWSAPYGLWMPWWNGIGGGMGIHELPEWPGGYKEGENHLGTPVSHGCIRLGVGPAQTVYNWADIGTPVYIHK